MIIRADARAIPLRNACIDACVTDPPYGLGFMGREWDTFKPEVSVEMRARTVKNHKAAANPNLKGRLQWAGGAAVEYDYSRTGLTGFQDWTSEWAVEVLRVLKPGAYLLVCGAPRTYHRLACGLEDAGFVVRDCLCWLFGQGFPKSLNLQNGKGTALKPAYEPICMAWKPFIGSITACHEQHGTAALNIDACRLPFRNEDDKAAAAQRTSHVGLAGTPTFARTGDVMKSIDGYIGRMDAGRWPANVVLDENAAALLDAQSGELQSGDAHILRRGSTTGRGMGYGSSAAGEAVDATYGDSGGASRFYYVAKPSREERDYGTVGLETRQRDESRKDGNSGGDSPRNRGLQQRGNFHPTVKPVELMRWLVKLVTPIGGIVLDPFLGSGTTGMACRYEQRGFIGIEREAEYVQIADHRISAVAPLFHAAKE